MNVFRKLDNLLYGALDGVQVPNLFVNGLKEGYRVTGVYHISCGPAGRRRAIGAVLDQQILDDIVREWYENE